MAFIIILTNNFFRIIIKNLTKCNILSTFAFKNYGKSTNHKLEKLCPRSWPLPQLFLSLASRGSVLEKSVLGLRLFFESLASKVVYFTPPLVTMQIANLGLDSRRVPILAHCRRIKIFFQFHLIDRRMQQFNQRGAKIRKVVKNYLSRPIGLPIY